MSKELTAAAAPRAIITQDGFAQPIPVEVPSLTPAQVVFIFRRLEETYGHKWRSKYPGSKPSDLGESWARQLAGIGTDAIDHALAHLPEDEPPNVLQFRALAKAHRPPDAGFKAPSRGALPPREIAATLRATVERITAAKQAQREADWRQRLGMQDALISHVNPIPAHVLPPGIRAALDQEQQIRDIQKQLAAAAPKPAPSTPTAHTRARKATHRRARL